MVRARTRRDDPAMRGLVLGLASALMAACTATGGGSAPQPPPFAPSTASSMPTFGSAPTALPGLARLQPASGAYFGLNLDWGHETPNQASASLGRTPAVWVVFVTFPLSDGDRANLASSIDQIAAVQGMALITLEPHGGLAAVTDQATADLGDLLARTWAEHGVRTFVRFAHEMNGSWYPWSQQPSAYVAAYQRVASAVHQRSPSSAMIWAPNEGRGYPFSAGRYLAAPGSSDAAQLDTDGDGTLDPGDDPYAPYYPGDDAVDWIGVSLYHWGLAYPWGENEMPPRGAFEALMRGTDPGTTAGGAGSPDLYAVYADGHDKPMAIVETAILYDPAAPQGPSERELKSAWFRQVFSTTTQREFPRIAMVNWFEWRKMESEVGKVIDWRLAADPELARSLLDGAPAGWLRFAGD